MARVNVEEELFAGNDLRKAGRRLGGEHVALGYLVFLWRDSQQALCVGGTKEEIFDWLRVSSDEAGELALGAFLESGFLRKTGDNMYEISGNADQIEARVTRMKKSQKGAVATRAKWDRMKATSMASSYASSTPQPGDDQASTTPNSGQCSSVQFNSVQAIQFSAIQKGSDRTSVRSPQKKPTTEIEIQLARDSWDAYQKEYQSRYSEEPVRNAKVNTAISQLVKRLGAEAPEVVRFFVRHNKRFYVEKCHDIGLCLADAEGLRTQWARGRPIMSSEAAQVDRTQSNLNAWDAAAEKLEARNE